MINLYPDQEDLLGKIRGQWKKHNRILVMAATGFGKTRLAARIIEGMTNNGLKVCFTVPRISLIAQTAKAFHELGLTDISFIHRDAEFSPHSKIVIASIDTLIRREKKDFDLVIVDECHHRRKKMLEWMEEHDLEKYIGLTATPYADWLGNYYTTLVKGPSMKWLIDNKRLSPFEAYAPTIVDLSSVKSTTNKFGEKDYTEGGAAQVMEDPKVMGDIVVNWLEHGDNELTIALCCNVLHANHVCNEFNKNGVNSEVITAKVPIEEREAIFQRMRDGITRVLCSVDCLTEGFDMPEASVLINARPTKSVSRWLQGAGRVLRYVDGKVAKIFDHANTCITLGCPDEIDIEELKSGGKEPKESDRKEIERLEKLPRPCPKCDYLKEVGVVVCPQCGYQPRKGEDVVTDTEMKLKKLKRKPQNHSIKDNKVNKQSFYSQLLGYQKERDIEGRPVSDGWVSHKYKDMFGVWPKGLDRVAKSPSHKTVNWIKAKNIAYFKAKEKAQKRELIEVQERRERSEKERESLQKIRDLLDGEAAQ